MSASRPPGPLDQGKELGLRGAPIPLEIVTLFGEFYVAPGRTLDPELSRVFVVSEQESPEEIPDTEAQRRAAAVGFIKGYESGLWFYLLEPLSDNTRRLSIHEMATLHPSLISASPNGLEAYVVGHSLQRPGHLEDGKEFVGNISVADAHALGFIVRAATLGIRVEKGEVPTDVFKWAAFELGMDRKNGDKRVSELFSEAIEAHYQDLVGLARATDLGKKISSRLFA